MRFALRKNLACILLLALVICPVRASAQQETTPSNPEEVTEATEPEGSEGSEAKPEAAETDPPETATGEEKAKGADQKIQSTEPAPAAEAADTAERLKAIEQSIKELAAALKSSQEKGEQEPVLAAPQTSDSPQNSRPDPRLALPPQTPLDPSWLEELHWRSIGPANMSGRITDIAVHEQDTSLWWIATASGGLLKTTNHGGSMEHMFDHQEVVSIGSIATDPNNKDVLWVGTGEINPRNSVSYGNGVYKTTDGGKTFEHMGLDKTFQIARVLVDPTDSDTVYVGAAGRLYGTNRERGVYKTTDGGKTWEQVLFVDDRAGVIDMAMHPENPKVIVAALWDRLRDGYDSWPGNEPKPEGIDGYDPIRKWGPGGGLYRTDDGGKTWTKLTAGLPTGMTGRIGLDWFILACIGLD